MTKNMIELLTDEVDRIVKEGATEDELRRALDNMFENIMRKELNE
ncbi:MAG: hypothetical protein ACFFER_11780 [Candidatus Thorarchaeota archaeon]